MLVSCGDVVRGADIISSTMMWLSGYMLRGWSRFSKCEDFLLYRCLFHIAFSQCSQLRNRYCLIIASMTVCSRGKLLRKPMAL